MKTIILCIACLAGLPAQAQSLVGRWQVTREENCLTSQLAPASETEQEMSAAMENRSGAVPKILKFNADNTAEQNWKQTGKGKSQDKEKFLYKTDGTMVYRLDKKSKLITDTWVIELLTENALVLYTKDRTCERWEFVRVNLP
jgi:hypothetical protein